MSRARSGCSEFPNDNPLLHDGAVWVCRTPCGPARAVVRAGRAASPAPRVPAAERAGVAEAIAPEPEAVVALPDVIAPEPEAVAEEAEPAVIAPAPVAPPDVVAPELEPEAVAEVAAPEAAAAPRAARDAFSELVQALTRAALAQGATRAAAALAGLLSDAHFDPAALDAAQRSALLARGLVAAEGGALRASDSFAATLAAWRRVLRAESDDLSACGDRTLDEWAAHVLGALLGVSETQERQLRRELRRQGVAAFGMIEQAA